MFGIEQKTDCAYEKKNIRVETNFSTLISYINSHEKLKY